MFRFKMFSRSSGSPAGHRSPGLQEEACVARGRTTWHQTQAGLGATGRAAGAWGLPGRAAAGTSGRDLTQGQSHSGHTRRFLACQARR